MGFIKDVESTGVTTYTVNIDTLKKMVAEDLNVSIEAITISAKMVTKGYQRDEYQEFGGLTISVDHSKNKIKTVLQYPLGVRGDTQFTSCGPRGYDESTSKKLWGDQIDSPCCGENRR